MPAASRHKETYFNSQPTRRLEKEISFARFIHTLNPKTMKYRHNSYPIIDVVLQVSEIHTNQQRSLDTRTHLDLNAVYSIANI